MKPNFLGIGAQRCGTTWAYECLAQHPQVFVSTPKELRYFSKNYDNGAQWYEAHFDRATGAVARGEITPGYVYREHALQRIASDLPDARLLLFLRNPVERAYSAYKFFRERYYRGLSFPQALEQDPELLDQGLYTPLVKRLMSLFDPQQVLILFFDDIVSNPDQVVQDMYGFLGVDAAFRPSVLTQPLNASVLPRTQAVLQSLRMETVIERIKRSPAGPSLRRLLARRGRTEKLSQQDRTFLQNYYRQDVGDLGALVGRDLHRWV